MELLSGWWLEDIDKAPKLMWPYFPGTICWGIWKERNKQIFNGKCLLPDGLINSGFKLLVEWVSISKEFDVGMWKSFGFIRFSACENLVFGLFVFRCLFASHSPSDSVILSFACLFFLFSFIPFSF